MNPSLKDKLFLLLLLRRHRKRGSLPRAFKHVQKSYGPIICEAAVYGCSNVAKLFKKQLYFLRKKYA